MTRVSPSLSSFTSTWSGLSTRPRARAPTIADSGPGSTGLMRRPALGGLGLRGLILGGDLDQLLDGGGRLGAVGDPVVGLLDVDLDDGGVRLRVVAADRLDVAAVAR